MNEEEAALAAAAVTERLHAFEAFAGMWIAVDPEGVATAVEEGAEPRSLVGLASGLASLVDELEAGERLDRVVLAFVRDPVEDGDE